MAKAAGPPSRLPVTGVGDSCSSSSGSSESELSDHPLPKAAAKTPGAAVPSVGAKASAMAKTSAGTTASGALGRTASSAVPKAAARASSSSSSVSELSEDGAPQGAKPPGGPAPVAARPRSSPSTSPARLREVLAGKRNVDQALLQRYHEVFGR